MVQTTFEQRVHFLVTFSQMFIHEESILKNNQKNEEFFYDLARQYLIAGLKEEHQGVLNHHHRCYKSDTDYLGSRVSLIQRLIEKACAESVDKEECKTKLHIPNFTAIMGLDDQNDLKKWINEIDIIWHRKKIATIQYVDDYIHFEILQRQ